MKHYMGYHFKLLSLICLLLVFLTACNEDKESQVIESQQSQTNIDINKQETKHVEEKSESLKPGDYDVFDNPYPTDNDKQVVVYEFFGYTCPHCFSFQPYMDKWLENKPDYIKLVRVPLNFQANWEVLQQGYFTAELMGIVEQSHLKLFNAIHVENKRFNSIEELSQWYANEFNINEGEFLSTANSFIVDSKKRKADNMGFKMQVTSTPTVIVNGKLRPAKHLHNREKMMQILDFLVKKEAKEMGLILD